MANNHNDKLLKVTLSEQKKIVGELMEKSRPTSPL